MRRQAFSALTGVFAALATVSPTAVASPAAELPAWTTIRFESQNPHTLRRYRITVLRPQQATPARAYPVIFMLDGNAVEHRLSAAPPAFPSGSTLPAIVTLGYIGTQRFDVDARTHDYTPPRTDGGEEIDPLHRERRTGGADHFLDFIEQTLIPEVAARIPLDREKLGLWGHSFGGLLALYAGQTRPGLFRCTIAASPSLWWRNGAFAQRLSATTTPLPAALLLTRGTAETPPPPPADAAPISVERWRARAGQPEEAFRQLATQLQARPNARVSTLEFPGLSHGQAFDASINPALEWFSRCADRPDQ